MEVAEWKDFGVQLYSMGDGLYAPCLNYELPYNYETDGEHLPPGTIMMCHKIDRENQFGVTFNLGRIENLMQEMYDHES